MPSAKPYRFADELVHFGPDATYEPPDLPTAQRYAHWLATSHYENFPVLSVAVPTALRQHFANVYAYCRWADDLGDEAGSPDHALFLLDWWNGELDRLYAGAAKHPIIVALAATIAEFAIPRQPFADLLTAFRQDQTTFAYATHADVLGYCRNSANPVGRLVLHLCRCHRPELVAWSDSICTGLQLANFCQDVGRDADIGRLYLPKNECDVAGVTLDDLRNREFSPAFAAVLENNVARARSCLRGGLPLVAYMPGRLRLAIALFAHGGLGICRAIRANRFNVLAHRPKLRKTDYGGIVARAVFATLRGR